MTCEHTRQVHHAGAGPIRLGVIGLGGRSASVLHTIKKVDANICVAALVDSDLTRALQKLKENEIPKQIRSRPMIVSIRCSKQARTLMHC